MRGSRKFEGIRGRVWYWGGPMYIFGNLTMYTYEIRISISVCVGGVSDTHPTDPSPPLASPLCLCMRIVLIKTALKNTTPVNGNTIDNASA